MGKKIQKFGGAMLTPVLLFTYAGMIVGIAVLCKNSMVFGSLAAEGTLWYNIWNIIELGARTIFGQMPIIFVIGLPVGLAKKENAKCCMEAILLYLTFNYFLNAILSTWGVNLGIDFASTALDSGLTSIAGIRTMDTGMLGALVISGIVVYLHNRFYDKELPEILGIFQGSCFVGVIGFPVMMVAAAGFAIFWPYVQHLISMLQVLLSSAGTFGIWLYGLLLKLLLPFGLHHFVYSSIEFDNIMVEGGTVAYWASHLQEFSQTTESLKTLFPAGGFGLKGLVKVFGTTGAALAMYSTAKPEKKKEAAGLLIPATFTAVIAGITEPLEYTFLFIAPGLFLLHAVLSATLMAVTYTMGVVGNFGDGILGWLTLNFIPLWHNHWKMYLVQFGIGILFIGIWWLAFRFAILKFDIKTPGREDDEEEARLITKKEYKAAKGEEKKLRRKKLAEQMVEGLGGKENILEVGNCMTRLRVSVKDPEKVQDMQWFKAAGVKGLVKVKDAVQIIIGMDVDFVRAEVDEVLKEGEFDDV